MASLDDVYSLLRNVQGKLVHLDSRLWEIERSVDRIKDSTCSSYGYDSLSSKLSDIKSSIDRLR